MCKEGCGVTASLFAHPPILLRTSPAGAARRQRANSWPVRISVIVPFHNAEPYIERCATALLAQDFPQGDYEVIFVDNNSTDGSVEILKRYPRIRIMSDRRSSPFAARNRAIADARGRIIAFTDPDCAPERDWLHAISNALAAPGVLLVQGRPYFAFESGSLAMLSAYEAEKAAFTFASGVRDIYYGYTNNMAVRRDVFARTGHFLEIRRGADVVFMHRVIDTYSCSAIRYAPEMQLRHLELSTLGEWLHKTLLYGRSLRGYGRLVRSRPLRHKERWRIFRKVASNGRYSLLMQAKLIVLLGACILYYELGRMLPGRIETYPAGRERRKSTV